MKSAQLVETLLRTSPALPIFIPMVKRRKKWIDKEPARTIVFGFGVLTLLLSPLVGAIPGPGGVFVFAFGLALCLRTSRWARRQYVRFKRWQPEAGRWADWGLRRKSARRRAKLREKGEDVRDAARVGHGETQS